ncbi:hypothetical protein Taro_002773 [Colocasia esculenta]|uniref:Uncharacterized protein n=1 Tax=Colocasia esculenta TaxID=4460 RepID=A0A843TJM7_COLES|nr:hypothetical protein [Colocasia esculenta]
MVLGGLALAVDRRRQFVKNQKAEGSDYVHLSTGGLLLSTGAGLPELLIFGLVASVDRGTPAVDRQCLGRTGCFLTGCICRQVLACCRQRVVVCTPELDGIAGSDKIREGCFLGFLQLDLATDPIPSYDTHQQSETLSLPNFVENFGFEFVILAQFGIESPSCFRKCSGHHRVKYRRKPPPSFTH